MAQSGKLLADGFGYLDRLELAGRAMHAPPHVRHWLLENRLGDAEDMTFGHRRRGAALRFDATMAH